MPGFIVDRIITRPQTSQDDRVFDFFLQSHQALKGTARSAHYVVLELGAFNVNQIQSLTYAFCFNYARATKSVSYAAPAYHADRFAERGTLYLKALNKDKCEPGLDMNANEGGKTGGSSKKDGLRMYERRVAQHIQASPAWNPHRGQTSGQSASTRKNPWHPNLDNIMLWL